MINDKIDTSNIKSISFLKECYGTKDSIDIHVSGHTIEKDWGECKCPFAINNT